MRGVGTRAARARATRSGLVRHRLTSRLLDPAAYLVGRVVAPAGSGKSRLLAHVGARHQAPGRLVRHSRAGAADRAGPGRLALGRPGPGPRG